MKTMILYLLAFTGGVFLAIQSGFNTQLSGYLKNPVLAVISTSLFSVVFATLISLFWIKELPNLNQVQQIPWYLWGTGAFFSVIGISLYFYTIPRLGISNMIVLGISGQLIFSIIAGKYGWLNLPIEPITTKRLLGMAALLTGIVLINSK